MTLNSKNWSLAIALWLIGMAFWFSTLVGMGLAG